MGELALFVMAWMLAIVAALDDYRGKPEVAARGASSGSYSQSLSTLD